MRKVLTAVLFAIWLAVSCNEPSPDKFPPPEFGPVSISLNGLAGIVQCEVRNAADGLNYGFLLNGVDASLTQEIPVKPSGGAIKANLEGLVPATDYVVRAFATNGINDVLSEEKHFSTEEIKSMITMPDPVFKKLILRDYDRNGDGLLSLEEAEGITKLDFCTDGISNIEGIECFSNLQTLICNGSDVERRTGRLTRIDLRQNNYLRYVETDGNNLKEMLLPEGYSDIEEIHCICNRLESFDLSGCPKLKLLYCWENNLSSLNLSTNRFLTDLRCAQNNFSEGLDVSSNKELRYFYCNDAYLQAIDVSENTELLEFGCYGNYIKEVDVSHNANLRILRCNNNLLTSVNVSANPELFEFKCENNYIKTLDLSRNTQLRWFSCTNNLLTSLDISALSPLLEELSIGDNDISEPMDLSNFKNLTLYGGNNLPLDRAPDFSHNPKLKGIHICWRGGAVYIDKDFFRSWPDIEAINICGYQCESIDFSLNTRIESLWASDLPNLRILDLSASPNLKYICLNGDEKLERVIVHKSIDIGKLEIEANEKFHGTIEHAP